MLVMRAKRTAMKSAVETSLLLACIMAAGFSSAKKINLSILKKLVQTGISPYEKVPFGNVTDFLQVESQEIMAAKVT